MVANENLKFKEKRALDGDITAICEVIDLYTDMDKWKEAAPFFELLVNNPPLVCENVFKKATNCELKYEEMLLLTAYVHYYGTKNDFSAFRWLQKTFDFLDYKYANMPHLEKEKLKEKFTDFYGILKDASLHDINERRFLLKWERLSLINYFHLNDNSL